MEEEELEEEEEDDDEDEAAEELYSHEAPPPYIFAEPEREPEVGEVHLIYKIEGEPDDIPVFELARTLEALGSVIQESDRLINEQHTLLIKVKPFQEGSFLMDLVVSVQNNPQILFFLSQPEAIARIKQVFEYIGLVKKGHEAVNTVMDVIRHLKNGTAQKVEPKGNDQYSYVNNNGQEMTVNGKVHAIYNNYTIQNNYYQAVGSPLQRPGVEGLSTYLKDEKAETLQYLPKAETPAIEAYSAPEETEQKSEVIENSTIEMLNPQAGTYGEPEGMWTFNRAGTSTKLKATITDKTFLAKFERGSVRFFRNDLLKVKLKHEQTVKGSKVKNKYEIVEVIDYTKAPAKAAKRDANND